MWSYRAVFDWFVDDYVNDLCRLSQVLGWPPFLEHYVNKSSRAVHPIFADIIDQISRMNFEDMSIYEYERSPKEAAVGFRRDA
jgi:hypothetical protein